MKRRRREETKAARLVLVRPLVQSWSPYLPQPRTTPRLSMPFGQGYMVTVWSVTTLFSNDEAAVYCRHVRLLLIFAPFPESFGRLTCRTRPSAPATEGSEQQHQRGQGAEGEAAYLHRLIEVLRLAFADTRWYCADMDKTEVPVKELLGQAYAAERARLFDPAR